MLKKIFAFFVLFLLVFISLIGVQPDEFSITREIVITAKPSEIYFFLNDLHQVEKWSPWTGLDPNMKSSFEGSGSGIGSIYNWEGNEKLGAGRMTIVNNSDNESVQIKIDIFRPFKAINNVDYSLKKETDTTTRIIWTMSSHDGFLEKMIHLFLNMEKILGPDLEKGLAQLKVLAETKR